MNQFETSQKLYDIS